MTLEYYCTIKEGELKISDAVRKRLKSDLAEFPDCEVNLSIKQRGKRSNPQNSYYWSVVVQEIRRGLREKGTRMSAVQTHEFLKFHFNKKYIIDPETAEALSDYGGSTTALNKAEFSTYIEDIAEWAAMKLGVSIPPPGTQSSFFEIAA